jgi:trehalose synthase
VGGSAAKNAAYSPLNAAKSSWSPAFHAVPPARAGLPGGTAVNIYAVSLVTTVPVPCRPIARLAGLLGSTRYRRLTTTAEFRRRLGGRRIWNVNSTASGGGVAEMLKALVGYVLDLDMPIEWAVIGGDPEFFAITKRLHNRVHGSPGDGGALGPTEAAHYAEVLAANAGELLGQVRAGDLVLLHDPQTAGLAAPLAAAGATVVWRCHIGVDWEDARTREAWAFLRPYLADAHAYVFSRSGYVPAPLRDRPTWIIPPSIDPFSPKNQELDPDTVHAILHRIGVLDGGAPAGPTRFERADGTPGEVVRPATVVSEGLPGRDDPVVVQVSRWDHLKDMAGVARGFASHVAGAGPGYLMLVGPSVAGVRDDPEGAAAYEECLAQWRDLPPATRSRILLVTLPLDDIDENGAMVNAVQRNAAVIVQKSIAEGFGLTVAEGMWKGRPVVASAVGGIQDQIVDGTGVLLRDPRDLRAFGVAVRGLLDDPDAADRMGQAAREHVREAFVGDRHLLRYAQLFDTLLTGA